jgi:hypothetical protein
MMLKRQIAAWLNAEKKESGLWKRFSSYDKGLGYEGTIHEFVFSLIFIF